MRSLACFAASAQVPPIHFPFENSSMHQKSWLIASPALTLLSAPTIGQGQRAAAEVMASVVGLSSPTSAEGQNRTSSTGTDGKKYDLLEGDQGRPTLLFGYAPTARPSAR